MSIHLNDRKKIIFCSYRTWSNEILEDLRQHFGQNFEHVADKESFDKISNSLLNRVIILAGWSWYIPKNVINNNTVVGLHPSDLPHYAGGSPIQNQIIDGIVRSKMSLFELNSEFDRGDIIDKQDLSLDGNMTDIFQNLRRAGTDLLKSFIEKFPDYTKAPQQNHQEHVRRLKHTDSMISSAQIQNMTARELYDFIRCREDPYPNVYLEDHTGRVYFKKVHFESKIV